MLLIKTVPDPWAMKSGSPVLQSAKSQVFASEPRDAGWFSMSTSGEQGEVMGPPSCGVFPVKEGQVWASVLRADWGMGVLSS
jgi:hypothetical protein